MKATPIIGISLLCISSALSQTAPKDGSFMLKGGTVHTISGPVIEDGSVLVRDGKIVGVGKNLVAPEGYKVIDVKGQQVYPGMIDSASMVGIEQPSPEEHQDTTEIGLFNPQLKAATAVNPDSDSIDATRANGVTSVVEMPDGELLSGQMSIVHLDGSLNDAMMVTPSAALHLRFPAIVIRPIPSHEPDDDDDPAPSEPIDFDVAKADYDRKMTALNAFFEEAQHYRQAKLAKPAGFRTDLRFEAMIPVLDGTTPLFVTAVREREIREAIEFSDKQKIKIVLADAYESYKLLPLIKAHNISVVLGPTLTIPLNQDDAYDLSFTIPNALFQAGITFSIGSFSSRRSRNLPYQAAAAVPFGLPDDEAYKAVSLNAAKIFGVSNRLGSIDEGKRADLIVTDGDPLEGTTHVNMVFIDGKPISMDSHAKQVYQKYLGQPPK